MIKTTPEGARDYVVPSRIHHGQFYALPQSPQLYKQILMAGGVDRYYQLARCLRDEDLRKDRQPEHTQIDLEMSFVEEGDLFTLVEGMMAAIFAEAAGINLDTPFPRIAYDDAMNLYGSDKPDLRFGCPIHDLDDLVPGCGFGVFEGAVSGGGTVRCLRAPQLAGYSRKQVDELEAMVKKKGLAGLARTKATADGFDTGIAKFLASRRSSSRRCASVWAARRATWCCSAPGRGARCCRRWATCAWSWRRARAGSPTDRWALAWVHDFPLFEPNDAGGWTACHHMFTMPRPEFVDTARAATRAAVRAQLYDLVLQRRRTGLGQHPDPSAGTAGAHLPDRGHGGRGVRGQVRLLPGCPGVRRAAARRHRPGPGPAGDAALRGAESCAR